jgi:thimet oligopeptidase
MVDIEYDKDLYKALLSYVNGNYKKEKKSLRKEDIRLLEETIREYRRMGFDLGEKKQSTIKSLLKKTAKLSSDFLKNINDYQDYILCTEEELSGMSPRFIQTLPRHTDGRYIVSLSYPHVFPYLAEAHNRKKREELANKNLRKGGKKNLRIIRELVELRHRIAITLGYKHHGDFRTENRMAKSAAVVDRFQEKLMKKLLVGAKADAKTLREHANLLSIPKLEHYDMSYVSTSLKKKLYDINPEMLREYFPLEHVRGVLFNLVETLFSITIKEVSFPLWHEDVKSFAIYEKGSKEDKGLVGYFSMDLFPREGKFGHAAMMDVMVPHETSYKSDVNKAGYSVMVCNFPRPDKNTPSLLSIGEVETLFHEFGHLLHMTLSSARIESQAGANTAWDFVETPSQIMENWVWNKTMLKKLSKHYKTGKSLDTKTVDKILKGKTFQNAYHYLRQIILGKIDMDMHTGKIKDGNAAYREISKKYFDLELPEKHTFFPAGFGHLVGYDAGYYSYLWALVYASDAFSVFQTEGNKNPLTNKVVGMRWRKEVLEKGSSDDEMKLISRFLKRKPNEKAFLKEMGI